MEMVATPPSEVAFIYIHPKPKNCHTGGLVSRKVFFINKLITISLHAISLVVVSHVDGLGAGLQWYNIFSETEEQMLYYNFTKH